MVDSVRRSATAAIFRPEGENAAHIRRSSGRPVLCLTEYRKRARQGRHISTRRGERGHLFAERASGAAIHSNVHVSLSAKIGDGRHICSRRGERGPYSPIERRAG